MNGMMFMRNNKTRPLLDETSAKCEGRQETDRKSRNGVAQVTDYIEVILGSA